MAGQALRKFLVHIVAMQIRLVTVGTGCRRPMRRDMALDAGQIRMRILALDQQLGGFAVAAGAVFVRHRTSISHRVLGRMGGMAAFAVGHCHSFSMGIVAFKASCRFLVGGMAFEAIHLGMGTGTFRHGLALLRMAGDAGPFDRCNF